MLFIIRYHPCEDEGEICQKPWRILHEKTAKNRRPTNDFREDLCAQWSECGIGLVGRRRRRHTKRFLSVLGLPFLSYIKYFAWFDVKSDAGVSVRVMRCPDGMTFVAVAVVISRGRSSVISFFEKSSTEMSLDDFHMHFAHFICARFDIVMSTITVI